MTDPLAGDPIKELAPVRAEEEKNSVGVWTERLVLFLRLMAGVSMLKGLYHWAAVCGFIGGSDDGFLEHGTQWQTATVFFAVIDLVAAVGLWLAAPWGAVVWLTAAVSMVVVNVFFQQVYGQQTIVVMLEAAAIAVYLVLAIQAAREQPQ
jgi:fatty acid desaturase